MGVCCTNEWEGRIFINILIMDYKIGDRVRVDEGIVGIVGIDKKTISYITVREILKNINNLVVDIFTKEGEVVSATLHHTYLKHENTDDESYSLTF